MNETKNKICPACGSDDIEERIKSTVIKEPFGGEKLVEIVEDYCRICETAGDFFNQNDAKIEAVIAELKQDSVINILNDLTKNKISLSAIERALNVPQRTLLKLKSGDRNTSSMGVALLKYLKLFPWLIQVAEKKFDPIIANEIYLNTAMHQVIKGIANLQANYVNAGYVTCGGYTAVLSFFEHTTSTGESLKNIIEPTFCEEDIKYEIVTNE